MTSTNRQVGFSLYRRPARAVDRGEAGASLVIALLVMIVMTVILTGLTGYAMTTSKASKSYANVKEERYAGDSAVKAAVAWAAANPRVGRDPQIDLSDPACRYTYQDAKLGNVTVSCAAEPGSKSGQPADVGLSTPEGLLVMSDRQNEPGKYNDVPCTGWWDSVTNFFKLDTTWEINDARGAAPEMGAWFRARSGLGFASATCQQTRNRSRSTFQVAGDIAATTGIKVQDGGQLAILNGKLRQGNGGCPTGVPAASCAPVQNRSGFTGPMAYLNGTSVITDPGRVNPANPQQNAVGGAGDIAPPFVPVGFNLDGSVAPLGYTPTSVMPSAMPERTTAYLLNPTTGALTATGNCVGTSATVVFLPGWYRNVETLNKYTASGSCADTTLWFAPDPGPDGKLLTEDDRTGAFHMDFRQGSGRACNGMDAVPNRWCVGGSPSDSPRLVAGTPKDWTPAGQYQAGGGGGGSTGNTGINKVTIDTAGTVDKDLSQSWYNNPDTTARKIDGTYAKYQANICVFWCFSSDRAIRVRNFTPKVTAGPIDGKLFVKVNYAVENPNAANQAQAIIEAVSTESGRKSCGTYNLLDKAASNAGSDANPSIKSYTFTDAQATQLFNACGKVDLVNGLEVKVQVSGNNFNSPRTNWYLDGVEMFYNALPGASFPAPTGTGTMPATAKTDCDPKAAGTQFVFSGDSHVYVADGSLEICAGLYPTDPNNHQSIGVWAAPAVGEVTTSVTPSTLNQITQSGHTSNLNNKGGALVIDGNPMVINYGGGAGGDRDARATIPMNGYQPPSGYRIQKVTARVSYHPRNDLCVGLFNGCDGKAPSLETPSCIEDFPKVNKNANPVQIHGGDGVTVLYDGTASRNCLNVTANGGSLPAHSITWHARAECSFACIGPFNDEFDGIAYQVTLAPINGAEQRLIPQTGCIVDHPNYNGGTGKPDCALARNETSDFADNWNLPWATSEGRWTGRFSVKGAIYAPSSAMEVDDTDVAYPLATRGAVLRHLRVSGFGFRPGYSGPAIGSDLDRNPNPREAVFTACVQSAARQSAGAKCDRAQDRIITQAGVRFEVDSTSSIPPADRANVPKIQWWSNNRT